MAGSATQATPAPTAAPASQSGDRPASGRVPHGNTVEMPAQFVYDVDENDPPPLTDDPKPTGLLSEEGEEQDDTEDDVEAIAETESAEEPEADGDPTAEVVALPDADWGDILLHSPQRITELKGPQRAAAIKASHERLTATLSAQAQAEVDRAFQQGMQNGQLQAQAMAELARLDALDPFEREEELNADPERKAAYHALKAGQLAPKKQAVTADPTAQLKADAVALFSEVRSEPFAADLMRNEAAGKYPTTLAGYRALVADIATFRARPAKPAAPPPEAAAAKQLKTGRTSAASAGTATPGRLTHERLDAMSPAEVERYMATPEGEAEIDALMATPRRR